MLLRSVSVRLRNLLGFGVLTFILLVTGGVALGQLSSLRSDMLEVKDVWRLGSI